MALLAQAEATLRRSPAEAGAAISAPGGSRSDAVGVQAEVWAMLRRLGSPGPVLVVVDDLDQADPASAELFGVIARSLERIPVLLLGGWREDPGCGNPPHGWHRSLRSDRCLRLEPLSEAAATALVREELARLPVPVPDHDPHPAREPDPVRDWAGPPPPEPVEWLTRMGEGNPGTLRSLAAHLVEAGVLRRERDRWRFVAMPAPFPHALTPIVENDPALLAAGLHPASRPAGPTERKACPAAEAARWIAVAGTLPVAFLTEALERDASRMYPALDPLLQGGLIREESGEAGAALAYRRPLVAWWVESGVGAWEKRAMHERLGSWYVANGRTWRPVADHLLQAGELVPAARLCEACGAAGREALADYDNEQAAWYLTRALGTAPRAGPIRVALLEQLAEALERTGSCQQCAAVCREAIDLLTEVGEGPRLAQFCRRLGRCHWSLGEMDQAAAWYERGLAILDKAGSRSGRAELLQEMGQLYQRSGRTADALRVAAMTLTGQEDANPEAAAVAADAHNVLLVAYGFSGENEPADYHSQQAVGLATRHDVRGALWWAHYVRGDLALLTGRLSDALAHLGASQRVTREMRSPPCEAWPLSSLALAYLYAGEWEKADDVGRQSVAINQRMGHRFPLPRTLAWLALLAERRGRPDEAETLLAEALRGVPSTSGGNVHVLIPLYCCASLLKLRSRADEALDLARRALAMAEAAGYVVWSLWVLSQMVHAALHAGRADLARESANKAEALLGKTRHPFAAAQLAQALGILAASADELACALTSLTSAASLWNKLGFPYEEAQTHRDRARVLVRLQRREEALQALETSLSAFDRLGAARDARNALDELRTLGAAPGAVVRKVRLRREAGPAGLTSREREVLRALAASPTRVATAEMLKISVKTLDAHLAAIYRKAGVSTRNHLLDWAVGEGLLHERDFRKYVAAAATDALPCNRGLA